MGGLSCVSKAIGVFYNSNGPAKCNDMNEQGTASLGVKGWDYLACTELIMPMATAKKSIFPHGDWDFKSYAEGCFQRWKVHPRLDWATREYGGK